MSISGGTETRTTSFASHELADGDDEKLERQAPEDRIIVGYLAYVEMNTASDTNTLHMEASVGPAGLIHDLTGDAFSGSQTFEDTDWFARWHFQSIGDEGSGAGATVQNYSDWYGRDDGFSWPDGSTLSARFACSGGPDLTSMLMVYWQVA